MGSGNVSLWFDRWLPDEKFCNMFDLIHVSNSQIFVRDMWRDGRWHIEDLSTLLS